MKGPETEKFFANMLCFIYILTSQENRMCKNILNVGYWSPPLRFFSVSILVFLLGMSNEYFLTHQINLF